MAKLSKNRQLHNKIQRLRERAKLDDGKYIDWASSLNKADCIFIRSMLHGLIEGIDYYTNEQIQELVLEMNWHSNRDLLEYVSLRIGLDNYTSKLNEEIVTSRIDNILESK